MKEPLPVEPELANWVGWIRLAAGVKEVYRVILYQPGIMDSIRSDSETKAFYGPYLAKDAAHAE